MKSITAIIKEGHKVASGQAVDSPYPLGSIEMQAPYFKTAGIDLDGHYKATLNLSIAPYIYQVIAPEFTVRSLQWAVGFPAEDFSLSRCEIIFHGNAYSGFIYYPHPETKIAHFHDDSLIEVISKYIPNIGYGDSVELKYNDTAINIDEE